MAKHCNVCNQDYADDLATCPHCAAAKKTQLASRGEERATQLVTRGDERATQLAGPAEGQAGSPSQPEATPADSAVNLGGSREGTAQGDSGVVVAESASDVALKSLMAETPSGESAAPEQPVSEKEVDDLLATLGETPSESAAVASAPEDTEAAAEEEAIAAAEPEEPAEVDEAEEEKTAKVVKPRANVLALAGATVLGIVLGAGGTIGVRALMGPGEKEKAPTPLSMPQSLPPVKATPTLETAIARVASGDWEEAQQAGIEQAGANAKELLARGEYRLGSYLKTAGGKINPQDPALQPALQDLQNAANQGEADAVYDLALIKELAGQLPEARAEYAKGAQTFQKDPEKKRRFESAIYRVELKAAAKAAGAARIPPLPGGEDHAMTLALLLVTLQPPQAAPAQQAAQSPPQPQTEAKEAGFEFWEAAKWAHEGKFKDALHALELARKLHEQRRFTRLRKAQNPLSDPVEDIFLRCCDELKAYWQLENQLRESGYLTGNNTPQQALQVLAQKVQESDAALKDLTEKLTAAQKDSQAKVARLEKMLQAAKEENARLDGELKAKTKTLAEREAALTSAKDEMAKLNRDKDHLHATLTKIRDELADAKFLGPHDKANVREAVEKVIAVAKTKDPQGEIGRQRDTITQLSAALKERRKPEEMLPLWLLLLDEARNRTDWAVQARADAQRVLTNPQTTAEQKGEAQIVQGLALRNTEKFSEAKALLEAGRSAVDKGEWRDRAAAALKEVSDPAAYFTRQAQELYDHGQMEAALALLTRALKVVPAKEQGKLLAQRSLIALDAARSKTKGALPPTEPLLIAARKDAEAAIQAGAAEGHYAAGRIAEELGQVDAAMQSYRAALAAHGGQLDATGGRYRMALARVLVLPREARPGPSATPGERGRVSAPRPKAAEHWEVRKNLMLMLTLGLQAPLAPDAEGAQEEAEKLADEVLKAPSGTMPFPVLAQALAIKGRWDQALQIYIEGLRPMLPPEYGNGLVYLLSNDPRLKRPDSLATPNPLEAEKHFAAGLNFYFGRDYPNAEKEFLLTIANDSQDARFFYFLGLSRLAQNRRRDAYADFSQAALLERRNRPAAAAVDESLERIQGPMRLLLNSFRRSPQP